MPEPRRKPSPAQLRVFDAIQSGHRTRRAIIDHIGLAENTVKRYLIALVAAGEIHKTEKRPVMGQRGTWIPAEYDVVHASDE